MKFAYIFCKNSIMCHSNLRFCGKQIWYRVISIRCRENPITFRETPIKIVKFECNYNFVQYELKKIQYKFIKFNIYVKR